MDEEGKRILNGLLLKNLSREQIKYEMIYRGYGLQEIMLELERHSAGRNNPPDSSILQGIPETAPSSENKPIFPEKQLVEPENSNKKYFAIIALIIVSVSFIGIYFAFGQDPEKEGTEGFREIVPKTVENVAEAVASVSNEALLSEEELEKMWEECRQKTEEFVSHAPDNSGDLWTNNSLRSTLDSFRSKAEICYANYSVMSGDYSNCEKIPVSDPLWKIGSAGCYLKIVSLNGDDSVCGDLAKIDKDLKYTAYQYSCYASVAKYTNDESYCGKIPLTAGSQKVNCVQSMVNEANYDKLCMSLIPCTNCQVTTYAAQNYALCFAKIAHKTGNNAVCDEALGFHDLCYMTLAEIKKDSSLCSKAGRFTAECNAAVPAAA